MKLFNTLTRQIEEFKPIIPPYVGMYTCGPTVYDHMHIGNLRTFLLSDVLYRALTYCGYKVKAVQNITDIDDKIIKRAMDTNSTIEDVAKKYTDLFLQDVNAIGIQLTSGQQPKATEYVDKMIAYIQVLLEKGLAYVEKDGSVYFDISKFPNYGKLSRIDKKQLKTGTRVLADTYSKDDVQDFALWKATPNERITFDSPWSKGRPGWHIECSVMSQELLTNTAENKSNTFDIHVGGIDLLFPHHENEIAQSEGKTGKQFVRYFVHGEHILVDGGKMSKSLNNFYTLDDVQKKGVEPLAIRFLFLQTHYRQQMNFTWEAAQAAQSGYNKLKEQVIILRKQTQRQMISEDKLTQVDEFRQQFREALGNDLQMPKAIAVIWSMLKSNIPSEDKLDLLLDFDQVLGLKLNEVVEEQIPQEITDLAQKRQKARNKKQFEESDRLRKQIEEKGYLIEDVDSGFQIKRKS